MSENKIPAAEQKSVVNCPKCSTSLNVKVGNYAYVCPVCNQIFRTRIGERLVKDVSRKTMVEAYVSVDKDAEGAVNADSTVSDAE
jgi:transposase-like protein